MPQPKGRPHHRASINKSAGTCYQLRCRYIRFQQGLYGQNSMSHKTIKTICTSLLLIAVATAMGGCSEDNPDQDNGVTTQGTVDLGTIKLGTSDQIFQE